jgi:hypothetical protein
MQGVPIVVGLLPRIGIAAVTGGQLQTQPGKAQLVDGLADHGLRNKGEAREGLPDAAPQSRIIWYCTAGSSVTFTAARDAAPHVPVTAAIKTAERYP